MTIITMIKIWLKRTVMLLCFDVAAEYSSMQYTKRHIVTLVDVSSCLSAFVVIPC